MRTLYLKISQSGTMLLSRKGHAEDMMHIEVLNVPETVTDTALLQALNHKWWVEMGYYCIFDYLEIANTPPGGKIKPYLKRACARKP